MSERRMIRRNHFFAVTEISGLAVIALAFCGCQHVSPSPAGNPVRPPAPVVNNPPVVVRGGSVEGIAPTGGSGAGWNQTSATTLQTAYSYDVSVLSLDGVALTSGGPTGQYSATGLPNTWKVTLFFRDNNGNDPGANAKTLALSASTDPAAPNKSFVALTSDGKGDFTPEGAIDGYDIQRYELKPDDKGCMKPSANGERNRKCDHVIRVEVQGVSIWTAGTGSAVSNPADFYCIAGECDIYIGKQ